MGDYPRALAQRAASGDIRALARCITGIENDQAEFEGLLPELSIPSDVPTIGITGPPGAGKSSLINALIHYWSSANKHIGIVAVDPSSPYNQGSLLGDRVRLHDHYNNPNVFIRSLATRGALGGISAKAIEVVDLMKTAGFDYIIVETVGVGQSEVEIASLADTTVVVTVPEGGDEVQVIKSGLMEVADVFVVNKADRPNAKKFANYLQQMNHNRAPAENGFVPPVHAVIATESSGIDSLVQTLHRHWEHLNTSGELPYRLAEKAYRLIQNDRMKDVTKASLASEISLVNSDEDFNIYRFVSRYLMNSIEGK